LLPTRYHTVLKDFLKQHEPKLWEWLASAEAKAGYASELKLDLLKNTYRLAAEDHALVYRLADQAKAGLGLDIPITLYQAQNSTVLNAAIFYLPGEGHIVFSGNVLSLLREDELLALLSHELAHYHLWNAHGGEYHVVDRAVSTLAQSPRASGSHLHTARNSRLYTEIYCDRASWLLGRDTAPMIRALVKMETGLQEVNAVSYLKQAREVLSQAADSSKGLTHPETYIRAEALSLWVEKGTEAEPEIAKLIEGTRSVDELDLPGQVRMAALTRELIHELLQPEWFRTGSVLGHARLFFEDFEVGRFSRDFVPEFSPDEKTREYLNYILLDFSVMDPELEQEPLKQAVQVARRWDLYDSFAELARKELKIKAKDWEKLASAAGK